MNDLQGQILDLTHKVDNLSDIVERLTIQVTEVLNQDQDHDSEGFSGMSTMKTPTYHSFKNLDSVMEHKDVLVDGNSWKNELSHSSEQSLTCELQVRRLTAQLTAAYNRIAALEEQLLARRMKS